MPTVPIILLGQIAIAAAVIAVAAWIVVTRTAVVAVAVSDAVIPILIPAAVLTVVFMIPPAPVQAIVLVVPVAGQPSFVLTDFTAVFTYVAVAEAIIPIPEVTAQVFAVAG